jgi:excisionase family DNA binding protein
MTYESLLEKYQRMASDYGCMGALVDAAAICRAVINDLELWKASEDAAELDLEEAAERSGYSTDHLRRLVRDGGLRAMRKGRRLFFLAGDLPIKPRRVDTSAADSYDAIADARQVAAQRIPGGIHGSQPAA